jgi:hypothetical protein
MFNRSRSERAPAARRTQEDVMRRFVLAVAMVALAVPGLATAQRGGGGRSRATSRTDMFGDEFGSRRKNAITSGKIQDLDPVAILIDKHKDLSLTDGQVDTLKQMNDKLREAQKPALHVLDSLNQAIANMGSNISGDDQSHYQTLNTFVRMVAGNLRQQYDSVENDARALMNDDQKQKADDVLRDSHDELMKLVGRGGRRGG